MMKKIPTLPHLEIFSHQEVVIFKPSGVWAARTMQAAKPLCQNILQQKLAPHLTFDFSSLKDFDTAGLWLIQRTLDTLRQNGYVVETKNGSQKFHSLLSELNSYKPHFKTTQIPPPLFVEKWLGQLGKASVESLLFAQGLLAFLGQVTVEFGFVLRHPTHLRLTSLIVHMERFGLFAIPIVALMSISLGIVLAYQGAEQLRRFGAEVYTINLVAISMVREVGILITAILVAGRSGSAITAQIGTMKINQEIDALHTLGLSFMEVLIIPRILALILVLPLLAFISDMAGLFGGGIMVVLSLEVSPFLYIYRVGEAITLWGFWVGLLKAPLFGAIIGVVSCFEGLRVKGTAESVGLYTTRSVVESIFFVTIADALLSIFFSKVGI